MVTGLLRLQQLKCRESVLLGVTSMSKAPRARWGGCAVALPSSGARGELGPVCPVGVRDTDAESLSHRPTVLQAEEWWSDVCSSV